jgi:hypothetical protein
MGLFDWLGSLAPTTAEIRAEIWNLGVRHRGQPLEGAIEELKGSSLSTSRTALLRACVQQLRRA